MGDLFPDRPVGRFESDLIAKAYSPPAAGRATEPTVMPDNVVSVAAVRLDAPDWIEPYAATARPTTAAVRTTQSTVTAPFSSRANALMKLVMLYSFPGFEFYLFELRFVQRRLSLGAARRSMKPISGANGARFGQGCGHFGINLR